MHTRFSIIVIHRNNFKTLERTFSSILQNISENDEIILVDNHSSDDSIEILETKDYFKKIKLIKNSCNAGYSIACNQGISEASGKYLIICNNDIEFESIFFHDLEKIISANKSFGLIGPRIVNSNEEKVNSYSENKIGILNQLDFSGRILRPRSNIVSIKQVETLRGPCLVMNSEISKDIGNFDEEFFFYHEEVEFSHRVSRSNKWKVLYAPEIKIKHYGGVSSRQYFKEIRIEFFRSRILFWNKTLPLCKRFIVKMFNYPKLFLDLTFYFLATIITFNLKKKFSLKMLDRAYVIYWLITGKPAYLGLPDKCKN